MNLTSIVKVVNKKNSLIDFEPVLQVKPVFGHICFRQQILFSCW